MPRLSPCVKCLFISFNIFFVIVGVLIVIISLALLSPSLDDLHGANDLEVQTTSRIVLYIVGSVTVVIAILGAYGAYKENRVALIVFLVCMVTGSLLMLRAGVSAAVARPKLESLTEEKWRSLLPLNQASDDVKNQVEVLQTSLHCCGLFSYKDWGENIPKSCLCSQEEEEEEGGECQTVNYGNFLLNYFRQKKSVFVQNCLPLIMDSVTTNANVKLAVVFTLFALALLGLVLSSLMIYKMFNTPLAVPVMFIDQPPSYKQLYNLAECLDVGEAKTL